MNDRLRLLLVLLQQVDDEDVEDHEEDEGEDMTEDGVGPHVIDVVVGPAVPHVGGLDVEVGDVVLPAVLEDVEAFPDVFDFLRLELEVDWATADM